MFSLEDPRSLVFVLFYPGIEKNSIRRWYLVDRYMHLVLFVVFVTRIVFTLSTATLKMAGSSGIETKLKDTS